ncbi:helix-turn-helix domain-containing protein [Pseudacidovorax intermedius]|uniref:helix-turn-helix domain-containing protein n=1 Tax=Pseudacidovorax intermedius TaxID=433924 RepID=UPI0005B9E3DA|nr:helix-turn-helix domain-containing protein [Pseudacidovorax intermedius]
MTTENSGLSHRLVKARAGHGWSQAELAEVSGVAAAQISRYEAGRSIPRSEIVAKLAKALAVRFEWLAYGDGMPEAGQDVPKYPASQPLLASVELDDQLFERIADVARANGWTVEMALKQLALEGLKARQAGSK